MDRQRISIDDLLAQQNSLRPGPGIRATIKADVDDRVTVTPVVAVGGCGCTFKITVNKADIEHVSPTDDISDCCGEKLMVVEVAFANETVASIFRQLSETASKSLKTRAVQAFPPQRYTTPPPWLRPRDTPLCSNTYQSCVESCGWWSAGPEDYRICAYRCYQNYLDCIG